MARLVHWKKRSEVKKRLGSRLRRAKDHRKRLVESQWQLNERTVYQDPQMADALQSQLQQLIGDTADFDAGESIEINYAFRNLRFLHAQLSSNPPVATPMPESSDLEDKRAAEAADQCMKWFLRQLHLQEVVDLTSLDTLIYGTGITRTGFDPNAGDIVEFDEEEEELTLEGEIEARRVDPWKFWVDPDATGPFDIRFTFEEVDFTEDEVKCYFPDKWEMFEARRKLSTGVTGVGTDTDGSTLVLNQPESEEVFTLYAYHEPGLPENGMLGRFCYCFEDGTPVTNPTTNPNLRRPAPSLKERIAYRRKGVIPDRRPPTAYLPYHLFTDIDVPGQVWGRSFLEYAGPAQNLMCSIDTATLEAVKAHGVARVVVPSGMRLPEDAFTNSSYDIIQPEEPGHDPTQSIEVIPPMGLPQSMTDLRNNVRMGVDDMAGMNESMLGQMSRETPATGMQYAVNQGSMIRRRLFNKYVMYIESLYSALLSLAIENWDEAKAIRVLGEEQAFDYVELSGIDIHGGYEIVVEYGSHLPLDPQARRDEMLKYWPMWKEAGLDPKVFVDNLKLAELRSTQDVLALAKKRAKEDIDFIIANEQYPKIRRQMDHTAMLAYCKMYVNTAEFRALEDSTADMIEVYMDQLAQAAAANQPAPAAGQLPAQAPNMPGAAAPATPPIGGAPTPPLSAVA